VRVFPAAKRRARRCGIAVDAREGATSIGLEPTAVQRVQPIRYSCGRVMFWLTRTG
jgi:hypothetical protein